MPVNISKYLTMKIGGTAFDLRRLREKEDIVKLVNKSRGSGLPIFILGSGSNTIFRDSYHPIIIGKMEIKGISIESSRGKKTLVRIGAGEDWDNLVKWAVNKNLQGIEALSGIPGTAGAAPIQNIGAYGSELADSLEPVEAYDIKKSRFVKMVNKECGFSYRDSVFKKNPGRWIISAVVLRLSKGSPAIIPNYKDVTQYFESKKIKSPSTKEIRKAILEIRSFKLPDPKQIPNCGSFFKNPVLKKSAVKKLKSEYPDLIAFPFGKDKLKVSAGWLIDKAGFKGYREGGLGVYKNNALVLINQGKGSFKDLNNLRKKIKERVWNMFGIRLEEEVNII